jgi:hypothetical protein
MAKEEVGLRTLPRGGNGVGDDSLGKKWGWGERGFKGEGVI